MESDLLNEIIELLNEVNNDECTPRLVRLKIREIYNNLTDEKHTISIRIDRSLQELDGINEDTNMPVYIKTQIWDIVSKLESVPQ